MKLIKGDTVKITKGKDSGKTGKVEKVINGSSKVLVEGVNQYKRHIKAKAQGQKSEIITITKPLPVGNVALICPKCKKQTRIGYKMLKDSKIRICKKCKKDI
ncbi:MAG TPA: 50S ribosomal protein L24 [Candidatus Saccharimonadales bacterium]|nr:50S ribosomal protein L24 [Candidatus Saccharimonadales bacterium]